MSLRNILVPKGKVNIPAILAGILILYIVYSGGDWWIVYAIGEKPTFTAYIAPYNIDISILCKKVIVPIIPYIELSGFLTYLFIGIACIVGGVIPGRELSKALVGFRALTLPIITIITIYIGLIAARSYVNVDIPLIGETVIQLQIPYGTQAISTYTPIRSGFTVTYYITLVAGVLAVLGRLVTGKRLKSSKKISEGGV